MRKQRMIFHVDVNSAFLSWEAVYRLYHLGASLDLRTVPSAVGGDEAKRHGIILAKSIPAKAYGVHTGEAVAEAKRKCPNLLLVPPNYSLYQRSSEAFLQILRQYTDRVEQFSMDEAFMDMTDIPCNPVETAQQLGRQVREELGFTVNVGVAPNKLLAKMASDFEKPDKVHTLFAEELPKKFWPLGVRDLFLVGPASERKLAQLGIHRIGELAAASPKVLERQLKSHGLLLWRYANGIDDSPVTATPPPNKSYGNSLTTARDVIDVQTAKKYLLSLAETVSARLRADGVRAQVVELSLRNAALQFSHHQRKLSEPTDLTLELYEAASRCFDELWQGEPVRQLGIHTAQLTRESARQMDLFSAVDYEKQHRAEAAVDKLRKRFGIDCVKRAVFLQGGADCIDHMGGGISREKRTVDYSKEMIL